MTPPLSESYREIPLTQGQVAKVSPHRYDELSQWKWRAWWNKNTRSFYAIRHSGMVNGQTSTVYMHRQILGLEKGDKREGDHENHDTLDYTDGNLRISDRHGQQGNKRRRLDNTSGFKGVSRHGKKWKASIGTPLGRKHLGVRDTPEAAYYQLYVPAARKQFGEFAHVGNHGNPTSPIEALPVTEL